MLTKEKQGVFEHLISTSTAVDTGGWKEVVAEHRTSRSNKLRLAISYTGADSDISAVSLRVKLFYESGGDDYPEGKVAGDQQTWTARTHTLPVTAAGQTCPPIDIDLAGCRYYTVEMNFTGTSAAIADMFAIYYRS